MPLESMGHLNGKWGICGFTSALYALYAHSNVLKHGKLSELGIRDSLMLAEISSYFEELFARGSPKLIAEIGTFCRSFQGYEGFSVVDYMKQAKAAAETARGPVKTDFSIGLPPQAVVDYLKRRCNLRNARVVHAPGGPQEMALFVDPSKELIIGVVDPNMTMYGGLCHWVYQDSNAKVHSWGNVYNDFTCDGEFSEYCVIISVNG